MKTPFETKSPQYHTAKSKCREAPIWTSKTGFQTNSQLGHLSATCILFGTFCEVSKMCQRRNPHAFSLSENHFPVSQIFPTNSHQGMRFKIF